MDGKTLGTGRPGRAVDRRRAWRGGGAVDKTSINLFKLLASALRMRTDRKVILSNQENFPIDLNSRRKVSAIGLIGGTRFV
jgi:kynureninase